MLYFLISLYVILAVTAVIGLLINGVRPSKTLAWLLAIFTIPVAGILFYFVLGRNRRKSELLKKQRTAFSHSIAPIDPSFHGENRKYEKLMHLIGKNCHFPPTKHNKIRLLRDGKTTFEAIFGALEQAKRNIYIQYYIFEEGELADKLLRLFQEKIEQGVEVRMIYDSIGSFTLSSAYLNKLKKMGVQAYPFMPFRFGRYLSSLNYRNHRKIIIVDGQLGFTGGINISDKYLKGDDSLGMWHDMHLELRGESVRQLETIFREDWHLVSEQFLEPVEQPIIHSEPGHQISMQIVKSGPEDEFPTIEQVYLSMITEADDYLYIVNPYIIPGAEILQGLQTAALSGVDVRILLSEKGDSRLVDLTVSAYFEPLLKAGVRLFLFPEGFIHSKIVLSDDDIISIGTANIDVRSFEHNYEVNALIYDQDLASVMRKDFLRDCLKSKELDYYQYTKRPWLTKLLQGAAKVFSPVL